MGAFSGIDLSTLCWKFFFPHSVFDTLFLPIVVIKHHEGKSCQEPGGQSWGRGHGRVLLTASSPWLTQPALLENSEASAERECNQQCAGPFHLKQEAALQPCLQANLIEAFSPFNFLLLRWLWLVSSWKKLTSIQSKIIWPQKHGLLWDFAFCLLDPYTGFLCPCAWSLACRCCRFGALLPASFSGLFWLY